MIRDRFSPISPKNGPPSFEYLSCATLHGRLSNSWALVHVGLCLWKFVEKSAFDYLVTFWTLISCLNACGLWPIKQAGWLYIVGWHKKRIAFITSALNALKIGKYTVSEKKRHPFYFCDTFVKCRPTLLSFGWNIPEGICSMPEITYLLKTSCVFVIRGPA